MNRAEKQTEVEFIQNSLTQAQVALCADYRGLTVAEITKLRKKLRDSGAQSRVVKNTLAKISAKKAFGSAKASDLEKFVTMFKGPSLLVVSSTDPVAPAKVISDFVKESKEKLKIKGGWIDGACLDGKGVDSLSKMPGKKETLAKLLSVLVAPATQFVRLLQAPGTQTVQVLEAHRKNLEEKGKAA